MKAQVLHRFGGVENFRLEEVPVPEPKPGYVRVQVKATSINPVDTKIRRAGPPWAPDLPAPLGFDVAGLVDAVGSGVAGFKVGGAVYGCAGSVRGETGADAEYMLADARLLAPKPASLDFRQAAALPLVTITAWEALFDRAKLAAGQTLLVHGGAGGVGHVAVQLAAAHGARAFATVSSEDKARIARELGAEATANYRGEMVESYVRRLTGGTGFDVVFDATGGSDLEPSFEAARLNGQVVTIVSQYTSNLSTMHRKGLSLHVVFMLIPLIHGAGRERHGAILREAGVLADAGKLRPLIDPERFALADLAQAHTKLESGKAIGKVVVDVA
jgi:NADPH:quinone reductase